jgi:AraC-like DNA-binding protein
MGHKYDKLGRKDIILLHLSRSATLDGYARVTQELGLDPQALVAEVGLPPASLTDPDLKVPTSAVLQLFELTAARAGVADFGLRVARTRLFSNLGVISLVMREQPNVRKAVEALAEHVWAQAEGLSIAIDDTDGVVTLSASIAHAPATSVRQNIELTLAVLLGLLRRFLGPRWVPEMVLFRHRKPASVALHISTFGCVPLFGQYLDAIVLRAADLDVEIAGADPGAASQLARYLEFVAGRREADFVEKVQHIVALMLPGGDCQAANVARLLGMDRRTLHRRLAHGGTCFSALLKRERAELAHAYIAAGDRSLTEIAGLLGFSSLSAFSRWRRQEALTAMVQAKPT